MLDKLMAIISRISTDAGFRSDLQQQPELALASYQLSTEEQAALKSMLEKTQNYSVTPNGFWW
jgi:hypothetical protein